MEEWFGRFREKFPILYVLIVGIGGSWAVAIIIASCIYLIGGAERVQHYSVMIFIAGFAWLLLTVKPKGSTVRE